MGRKQLGTLIIAVAIAALAACSEDTGYVPTGGPVVASNPLSSEHAGWQSGRCSVCHDRPHGGAYAFDRCASCHGDNGAPALTEVHTGWSQVECGLCHVQADAHGGQFTLTACGGCHGGNGAPPRPNPHWLEGCNDCHADGTAPWRDCSHDGLEPSAPLSCIYCHR
jgi:hypothetical protein